MHVTGSDVHLSVCNCPACMSSASPQSSDTGAIHNNAPVAQDLVLPGGAAGYIKALFGTDDAKWGTATLGTAATVQYSFGTVSFANPFGYSSGQAFNGTMQTVARELMDLWEDVANVTFTSVAAGSAKMGFHIYDLPNGVGGQAATWATTDTIQQVEVTMDVASGNYVQGGYGYMALMHEIGHGIGLKHPGNYNAGGGGADGPYLTDFGLTDSRDFTVMSYYAGTYASGNFSGDMTYPITPMLYDIAALQAIYGANTSYNSGNNTYTLNSSSGMLTRWDGGGTDTLNSSSVSSAVTLDLREGASYVTHVGNSHSWNAFGANIENATSGAGNDTLYGNSGNNILTGGAGTDSYNFGLNDGSDQVVDSDGNGSIVINNKTLTGTATVSGGAYTMTISGTTFTLTPSGSDMVVTVNGGSTQVTLKNFVSGQFGINATGAGGGGGSSTPVNFKGTSAAESRTGGTANDSFKGNGGADTLTGGAGNDNIMNDGASSRLYGEAGNDTIKGAGANSLMEGGADDDIITGNGAGSTLTGGAGVDTVKSTGAGANIDGGDGNDILTGTGANATIVGGLGNDSVKGGATASITGGDGDDVLAGGAGSTVSGGADNDTIKITGSGTANGGTGNDVLSSTGASTLNGDDGADNIKGSAANDTINGGNDNDTIAGGNGADTINAGAGDDSITGANGNDTIDAGTGNDIILGANDADSINGNDGDDNIDGGNGLDTLVGGLGADTLFGGKDNDMMTGGAGADVFRFGSNQGTETITDFQVGVDHLEYIGGSVVDASMLQAGIVTDMGNDLKFVVFKTTIILQGVDDISDLTGQDFIL